MGTRADFYVGRDPETMEWLGSIAWSGYPGGIPSSVLQADTEGEYRAAVAAMLAGRDDGTTPDQGWPWPWDDSRTSDYAYTFDADDDGAPTYPGVPAAFVWFTGADDQWVRASEGDHGAPGPRARFPNMRARKNVTLGRRSGVILVRG